MRPKKPARNTREYIDRKKENAICCTSVALYCLDETRRFLLWTLPPTSALHIPNLSEIASHVPEIFDFKNWLVSWFFFSYFFFLLLHTYKNCYKTRTPYPIALKFGTQKGGIKAHLGTNYGWNMINRQRVMSNYSRKITPICCHAYRLNGGVYFTDRTGPSDRKFLLSKLGV